MTDDLTDGVADTAADETPSDDAPTSGVEAILHASRNNIETIAPVAGLKPPEPKKDADGPSGADSGDGGDDGDGGVYEAPRALPPDFPVLPLGQVGGKFYFLTARDEMAELTPGAMAQRASLVALVSGDPEGLGWLEAVAPPKGRDIGFSTTVLADRLMAACSALPLFDPTMPIRHWGTWRGAGARLIVHLGEDIECPEGADRRGRMIGRALYPAVPGHGAPAVDMATSDEIRWLAERLGRYWQWRGDIASPDVVIGWIGQAALGQYPDWRTHMWIKGKNGSGKSTLLRIISWMLGGMSSGVKKSTSAAAIRQTTNRQAIARIFDEAEADGSGRMEDVIALFRLMSDADGAQFERGTSDHSGVRFALYGAGLMASIIPGAMTPQDRSRFVTLDLGAREASKNPGDDAAWLAELEEDAQRLGDGIWRRMLSLAPDRWDRTYRYYSGMIEAMGSRARDAATIGAILTGWDLMLHDAPVWAESTDARTERAKEIAAPLMRDAKVAEEEGEGERCLRHMLGALLHKDHGGVISASEVVEALQDGADVPDVYQQRLLGRLGLRLMDGKVGAKTLFVSNAENPQLNKALAGTRWRGGGHRSALDTLDGVGPSDAPIRIFGGSLSRGLIVPAQYLPGFREGSDSAT